MSLWVIVLWVILLLLLSQQVGLLERLPAWLAGIGLVGLGFTGWTFDPLRRAEYMRSYLNSRWEGPHRAVVRAQLLDLLLRLAEATYERLLLIAHSHGAVIAVDLLGSDPPPECPPLHLVTMGSSIIGVRLWEEWIDRALGRAFKHPRVAAWTDLYAPTDLLCGPVPGHAERFGAEASVKLEFVAPWTERVFLQTHDRYLDDAETAGHIAKAAEALAVKTRA